MEAKKRTQNINKLAIAALISEAYFDGTSRSLILKSPVSLKKISYLEEISKNGDFDANINISQKKGQFNLHSHTVLEQLKNQWYKDKSKIFSSLLDPNLINLESIIICINLFGTRKLETISIPTTIDKEYIKAISYCIEQHLDVPVIPGTTQIKITNVPEFIRSKILDVPTIHSTELVDFLTDKEKKRLVEGAPI